MTEDLLVDEERLEQADPARFDHTLEYGEKRALQVTNVDRCIETIIWQGECFQIPTFHTCCRF